MRQKSFRNYYNSKEEVVDGSNLSLRPQDRREVIPLSRSPIALEEEYSNR
jgi:hypothetical protein